MEFQKNFTGKRYGTTSIQNGEELFTEQSGYIPAQKRIENLLMAGQRLIAARSEMYDYPADHKGPFEIDPTRTKGYDMADATQHALAVHDRLRAQELNRLAAEAAAKKHADAQKEQKAENNKDSD